MTTRIFGHIPGVPVGATFPDRKELSASGVHRPPQAGISGTPEEGADSIVVSGGYVDDEDYGDVIVYTGQGGNDPVTKQQIADQEFKRGNAALARSCDQGLPLRVVRGFRGDRAHSPASGLRYDGLYAVESYWSEKGKHGFRVWRFRLVQQAEGLTAETTTSASPGTPAKRIETTVQRLVRSTAVVQRVKELHDYRCQVCGIRIETPSGPYAEGAHIRALGRPHDGPDEPSNVLCLCPNDHVRFDSGGIYLDDGLSVVHAVTGATAGKLRRAPGHAIALGHVGYHRGIHAPPA